MAANGEGLAHDVFLSFRGEDVRKSFIDHLRSGLKREGITAIFYDDTGLERGDEIQLKLYEAIDRSKMAIVTFSPRYAESRWCLDELVRIMERRSHGLIRVLPVFYDVDPTDIRHQTGSYQEAFQRHKVARIDRVTKWMQVLASAADLAGIGLQNQANGYEAKLIKLIVNDVVMKLDPRQLDIPKYMVGRESYLIQEVSEWLRNGSLKVEVGIIHGPGGVGKTTAAKVVYNENYRKFKSRSFLANVRTACQKDSEFICLQKQLIRHITRNEDVKIDSISEGREKIKNIIGTHKILIVLDDVEDVAQFHKMFDCPDWFLAGSKILITTRDQHLLVNDITISRFEPCLLDQEKSAELFSYHAFGQAYPPKDKINISLPFIAYCGGLPLALEVLASSLRSINSNMWKSQYERLQDYLDEKVFNVLSWSFDSLHDTVKDIFLHIAFYMIDRNKEYALMILDGCGLHGKIGLEDLIGKCLVSVDNCQNTLSMHHLIQQMGHEIVRQKPPIELGRRSRILGQKDAYKVLLNIKKKSAVKGLHLDNMDPYDDDISSNEMYVRNTAKRMRTTYIRPTSSSGQHLQRPNKPIKTSAFTEMENLDLLLLENVELYGSFDDFPKEIKWLLWKGCPLKEIPFDFELDELVVLDMQRSCLVQLWNGLKRMVALKILNLSHSHQLVSTPDLSSACMLEWIWCEDCINLIDVHESIGKLENLTQLNVKGCVNLVTLPESIRNLKKLTSVIVDDCRNLKNLPINIGSVLHLDGCPGLVMGSYRGELKAIYPSSCSKSALFRFNIFLPNLRELSLARCGISRDDVMEMLSSAPSLRSVNLTCNPIRVLGNMDSGRCLNLHTLVLNDCSDLQYVSNILPYCKLWAENCESLKRIRYHREMNVVKEKQRRDVIQGNDCPKLVEKELVVLKDAVIERTSEMSEDQATYLGYPNLSAFDYAGTGCGFHGRGVYQGGTYCVCIPGDQSSMLAEWFPTPKLATGPHYFMKHYRVPSFHPRERRIRALNLGWLCTNRATWRFEIENINRMWRWFYNLPKYIYKTEPMDKNKSIWLTHWCVMEHRRIMPGDLLQIKIRFRHEGVGVKLIYEDGEEAPLEEEVEELTSPGWLNTSKENDDSAAADDDVVVWYDHTFRSMDLSSYESLNSPRNWTLYNIKPVGGRDAVIEWTNRMTEDRSTYLGFPNLSVFGNASMSTYLGFPNLCVFGNASMPRKSYGRGEYRAGTYCVCIPGYHSSMLAEWFPTKLATGPHCFSKRYKVPSFHPKERPIRALNVGFLGIGFCELVIMNLSRMWKWTYFLLPDYGVWLTHWCVTEHRQIAPGDELRIFMGDYECMGVRVKYEDGEGAELEVEVEVDDDDDDSDAAASATDVAAWYNRTFRSTDLSVFQTSDFTDITNWRCYDINDLRLKNGKRDNVVFEQVSEMSEDRARYLGFPNLSAFDYSSTGPGFHEWGAYQAGMYCVRISDNNFSKLAEWFPAKLGTGPCFKKRYRVPCFHLKERPIRALNVGFWGTDKSRILVVENISRRWTWHYHLLWRISVFGETVEKNGLWLTHWCVTKHRHITHGDVLQIDIDLSCKCVGVKLIYEDGEEAPLEEEECPLLDWIQIRTKTTTEEKEKIRQLDNQRGREEYSDGSAAAPAPTDVVVWYNHTFRSTDLSFYESPDSPTNMSPYDTTELSYPVHSL